MHVKQRLRSAGMPLTPGLPKRRNRRRGGVTYTAVISLSLAVLLTMFVFYIKHPLLAFVCLGISAYVNSWTTSIMCKSLS